MSVLDVDKLRQKIYKTEILPRRHQIAKLMQNLGPEDKGPTNTYNKLRVMREVSKVEKQLNKLEKALDKKVKKMSSKP
jgi:hypothetical protein